MKFKKDGKVYESFEDAVDAFFLGDRKIFANGEKTEFKFPDDVRQSMIWAFEDADMGRVRLNAKLMGYEMIEDKPDTEKGVIMNNERKMSILLNTIGQMACDAEDKGEIDFGLRLTVEDAYALCHAASHTDNTPDIREVVEKYGEGAKPKRRTLGVSNPTDDITEYVEKYLEAEKPDPVNRPAHYTSGGIECIDAMQAAFGAEAVKDFCLCNAFKYLWRHRSKNGVEDLKKCRWYLNRLIREMEVTDDDT